MKTGSPYRKDDSDNEPLESAREMFLDAYSRHQSSLLASLKASCLRVFPGEPNEREPWSLYLWQAVKYGRPDLGNALAEWANRYHLTFKGVAADWAMNTALMTLGGMRPGKAGKKLHWTHTIALHEEYPAPERDRYLNLHTGQPDDNLYRISIQIDPWMPGETERAFRGRFKAVCKDVLESYLREIRQQGWTTRPPLERPEYIEGLAMWQAGATLREIALKLHAKRLYVGDDGDYTAISHGIDAVAEFIQLDRRVKRARVRSTNKNL
jgi:hypothetical protein